MRFLSRLQAWTVPACIVALGALPTGGALAQNQPTFTEDQPQYETPLFNRAGPTPLEQNYGLPTFGTPGATLPQQKATTMEKVGPTEPDFFKGATEIDLPKARAAAGRPDMETPLFTTSEGSTTDDTISSHGDMDTTSGYTTLSDRPARR
jgi:hypothetical protein